MAESILALMLLGASAVAQEKGEKTVVLSIVLEIPNSALGTKDLRLWARTLSSGDGGAWIQAERGARPAQAVLLVEERDAYLAGEPADDGRFLSAFAHALEHTVDIRRLRRCG
jgi:hypothetical protein